MVSPSTSKYQRVSQSKPIKFSRRSSKAFNSFLQYFTTKSKKIYAENVMIYLTYYLTDNKYIILGFKYILGSYDIAEDDFLQQWP